MIPNIFRLRNGLTVILVDTKAFPTLTMLLLVGAGSRYENEKNNGVAHFFEHMVFKGSKKHPTFFEISSIIEGLGAVNNAFTTKDHTGYWIKGPSEHFETMLDVLADTLLNPLLKIDEIEREKGVIVEEMNMYEDTPYRRVGEYFEELLYEGNSLGFDIIGNKKTLMSFDRNTFVEYRKQLYYPDNAVLVVAGGLFQYQISNSKNQKYKSNIKYLLHQIEEKFADWRGHVGTSRDLSVQKLKENQQKPNVRIIHKKTEQSHFCLGFRTFSFFDKRKTALAVFTAILGGGSSSRLFIEVRERRGLCYYIYTGKEHFQDAGYMSTQAGVTNNTDKIKQAIDVILKEHKKIAKGEVNDEDISRVKEMVKGRILLSMEDSANVASWHGTKFVLEKKTETVEEVLEKVDKVKKDEIVQLAKDIIKPKNLNLTLIGPFEEKDFPGVLR